MSLMQILQENIKKAQGIAFVDFMQLALYTQGFGYYSSNLPKLGRKGDFITAPELTPLFGQTLAQQCQQILPGLTDPILFEFGAGSGKLCVDLLQHLENLNCLPRSYYILELSASLRQQQQAMIQKNIPHLATKIQWLEAWPTKPFNGIIIANEVLDAMPINRFMITDKGILESYIILDPQNLDPQNLDPQRQLQEIFRSCQNSRLLSYIKQNLPDLTAPYLSEVNLFIDDWLVNIYNMLQQGLVLLMDYGFPRNEYYHPQRAQGTLMCHYKHHSHINPLLHVGEQDITAHVDFTHVAQAGQNAGFKVAGFTNQAFFLLANGLLDLITPLSAKEQIYAKQAIKVLTHPTEMGELFKVMALTKNLPINLTGFQLADKRVNL